MASTFCRLTCGMRARVLVRRQLSIPRSTNPGRQLSDQRDNWHVVNKKPISETMTDSLYAYILQHNREPQVLSELRLETSEMRAKRMQVSPEQGQLMAMLVQLMGAEKTIDVGVFTGYSSVAVALALPPHGKLVAVEKDERILKIARKYWEKAGVKDKVEERLGDGLETLKALLEEGGQDSYDFAFLDADKGNYVNYYEQLMMLVRPGGLIIVDNTLWRGQVVDPMVNDKATRTIRELNSKIVNDDRISMAMVPVGDGVALCRKL